MEGIMVSAATGVMNSLLTKLTTLLGEEYKLQKEVKPDVAFLKDKLSSINALFEKLADTEVLDPQVREWKNEIREMAYDIEDCCDCIDDYMHRPHQDSDKSNGIKGFFSEMMKLGACHEIAELDAVLDSGSSDVVGIDVPRDKLIKLVDDWEKSLKVVSIVGFGGLGKTTLANQVYQKVGEQFDCRAFVSVSQKPDFLKILRSILFQIGKQEYERTESRNEECLINALRDFLKDKRYFIVIDDIWSTEAWEIIKCALLENTCGSRILVTTRIATVAKSCCSPRHDLVYELRPLSKGDSKSLFFRRVFGSEDKCPLQLKEVSTEIIRKCCGVPLAIITMSSLLTTKSHAREEWLMVLNSLTLHDMPGRLKSVTIRSGEVINSLALKLLEKVTGGFSEENKIGSGGYGKVYKGILNGKEIAVKKLHGHLVLDDVIFKNEFENLKRVQHQNIVKLVGYCHETRHINVEHNGRTVCAEMIDRVLCFEYLQNGSLDKHLYEEHRGLDWCTRYKIIKGICEGLNYLHGLEESILHLDLKPANILLDENMVPKIADFGLSRLFGETHTHITKNIAGTGMYMPPEYIREGIITKKYDVFSLGVIIIQIMTGHKGYSEYCETSPQQFIELVHQKWKVRVEATSMHTSAGEDFKQVKRCIEIALNCVKPERQKRPTIGDIIHKLRETETVTHEVPMPLQRPLFGQNCSQKTKNLSPFELNALAGLRLGCLHTYGPNTPTLIIRRSLPGIKRSRIIII